MPRRTVAPAPVTLSGATTWRYQWLRNGSAISGANAYKYKLTSADRGKKISLRITYYHIGFPTGSTTSKAYTVH